MLYGFVGENIVGRVSIRHSLNDYLKERGGHIGYSVAGRYRGNGYGTEMMRQTLPFCKNLGIDALLVTCADENVPSWKIIESVGGTLQDKVWDDEDKEMIRRYWIRL
jgi:predicted acetyltransferase